MKATFLLCVFMCCFAWVAIEFSHDAVRNRELDVQLELARAIGKYSKPSLSIEPSAHGKDRL